MRGIERHGDLATCLDGHTNTGSTTVFANGKGVSRSGIDTAGTGLIGGGSPNVRVEGYNASWVGDPIAPHPCFPNTGCDAHGIAKTANPSTNIIIGDGF